MIPVSDKLTSMLNAQVAREIGNSYLYSHFSSWAHSRGLRGIESFFSKEAEGELEHAKIFKDLILNANAQLSIPDIPAKPSSFASCEEIAQYYVEAESETTDHLEEIYKEAESEGDVGVSNVLQGLLEEQIEEMGLSERLSNLVQISNGDLIKLDLALR